MQKGRLRPIFVTSPNRNSALPAVPTADRAGLPGFHVAAWIGLFGPRGLPPEIVRRASTMLNEACWDPTARQRLAERSDEIDGGTVDKCAARVRCKHAEWGASAQEAGIRAR